MSAALRSFETQWRARTPDALQPIREQAMQRFLKLGLPSQRDETWRYTDLRSLAAQSLRCSRLRCRTRRHAAAGAAATQREDESLSLVNAGQHAATLDHGQWLPAAECRFTGHKWH